MIVEKLKDGYLITPEGGEEETRLQAYLAAERVNLPAVEPPSTHLSQSDADQTTASAE